MNALTLRLTNFISAMNEWEIYACALDGQCKQDEITFEQEKELREKALLVVFDEHLCLESYRIYLRPSNGLPNRPYSSPPEYDSETEKILKVEEVNSEFAKVYTEETAGYERKLIYEMVLLEGKWKVKNKFEIEDDGHLDKVFI